MQGNKVLETYQLFDDLINGNKESMEKSISDIKPSTAQNYPDSTTMNLALSQFLVTGNAQKFFTKLGKPSAPHPPQLPHYPYSEPMT